MSARHRPRLGAPHPCLAAASLLCLAMLASAPLAAADGVLDPKFNGIGAAVMRIGNHDFVRAVAVQPDGKVLLAGRAEVPTPGDGTNSAFAIARLNANGTPDLTFGPSQNGKVTVEFDLGPPGFRRDMATAIAVGFGGRIVVCGTASVSGSMQRIAVAQLTPTGALDLGFGGGDGKVDHSASATGAGFTASCSLLLRGFHLLLTPNNDSGETQLLRLDWNGDLDSTFAFAGRSDPCPGCGSLVATVRLFNGRLLTLATNHSVLTLARYLDNGSLDTSFGAGGTASFRPPGANPWDAHGMGLALDSSGRAVALAVNTHWFQHAALVRFRGSSVDPTFGNGGWAEFDFPAVMGETSTAQALMIQSDGKPVVVGSTDVDGTLDFVVTRRTVTGAPDPSFGSGGWATVAFDVDGTRADAAMAVTSTGGRLLLAGYATVAGQWQLAAVRLQNALVWNDGFESGTTSLWEVPLED